MQYENHDLLTPAEVAQAFRVDPKTVTRWAKAGKLASFRTLGGHRRYRRADVEALLRGEARVSEASTALPSPHEFEGALINAVHRQALVLLLIEPDGTQRAALRAYAEAARIDHADAEAEVTELATEAGKHERAGSRLAARAVVAEYVDRLIAVTPKPVDDTPPTRVEQDVCQHCGRQIRSTDVDPTWRHLEGRVGSAYCASVLDSPVACPRTQVETLLNGSAS